MSNAIITETAAGSLIVRFNRPSIRSPLSTHVLDAIDLALDGVPPSVTRVIFTGVGNVFASGADLREIAAVTHEDAAAFAERGQRLMNRIAELPQLTIAAVNGFCFGGALDLALACDRRIAAPSANFCHPGAGLGIITGWGGTQRLPRLVGEGNALEMFLTAAPITASRALAIGLIDLIADDPLVHALDDSNLRLAEL